MKLTFYYDNGKQYKATRVDYFEEDAKNVNYATHRWIDDLIEEVSTYIVPKDDLLGIKLEDKSKTEIFRFSSRCKIVGGIIQ